MSQEQPKDPRRPAEEQETEQNSAQPEIDQDQPIPPSQKKTKPVDAQDKTRPMAPYDASEAGGPLPDLDEGPRPGPVDEVQEALFSAAQENAPAEVDFDELPEPLPDLDEGPRPGPVDEVQEAIFEAAQQGTTTEVDFDELPEPGAPKAKKVVKFHQKPPSSGELTPPKISTEPIPLPEFPDPDPVPTVSDFWLLLALFTTFRLLTLFLLRPGGFLRDWSDFDTYFGIAALSDYSLWPFVDFWLEWPPLVPWLAVAAYKLSLWLPPWSDDPRLWFVLILGSVFVLFEIGNFVLIHRLARKLFESPVTISRVLWLYAGLFPPIYAMLGFFDGIALFFILLALDWLLDERRFPSAVSVGVGLMVKIVPVLMLPVALRRLWYLHQKDNREAGIEVGLYSVVFGLTVLALLVPFWVTGSEWVLASARSMLGRASWETVWAVVDGYYGFGVVLGDRLNPAETDFAAHGSRLPWWLISLLFAGLYGFIFTRPADYSRPRPMVAFSGLTVAIFMLSNKGYSPQFLVYLLPFILLLFPDGRGLTYALIFTGLNVLEQPIYFVLLPEATWLLTFAVIVRFLLIIILGLEFALVLWPTERRLVPVARLRQPAPLVLAGLAGLVLLVLTPVLLRTYAASHLQTSPVSTLAGFMRTQTGNAENPPPVSAKPRLLLSDQTTYRQLFPYLSNDFELELADGAAKYSSAPKMIDLLQGIDTVWILPTGAHQQALHNTVDKRGQLLAAYDFEGLGTASLYSLRSDISPFIAPARFIGGIELLAHHVDLQPDAVELTLYWRAGNPQTQSLTVFTHLLDADGQWIAGHDSVPANGTAPTIDWTVDAVQADPHRIELPADLPPGDYTLFAGLYNSFNERLHSIDPDGVGFANRAVPLETVQLP